MRPRFVGRERELEQLGRFLERPEPGIAVVYGRRRIGKSSLIERALAGRPALVFEGLENQPKSQQIDAFLFQLARQTGRQARRLTAGDWREALIQLEPALKRRPACVVLDELQWLANYRRDLVANLKMIWEQSLAKIPGVKLVLCGSIASFMTTKVVQASALYGRTDLELHLRGFDLGETKQLLGGKGLHEVIDAYLYVGGVPKYLALLRDHASVHMAMQELAFQDGGYFVEEYERVFTSHFGRSPDFRNTVATLAAHPGGMPRGELAKKAGLALGGTLSAHLVDLEAAGFITSEIPLDKEPSSRLVRYRLSDHFLRFYFCFIRPSLRKIAAGTPDLLTRLSQTGRFHAWRGRAFEQLCLYHARRIAEILGFPGVDYSFGPYFRASSPGRAGLQIDLLYDRADKVLSLCEMKCSVAPVGMNVVEEVERKVELLAARFPNKTIQRVLVVHGEPSRELERAGYFYRIIRASELVRPRAAPPA